MAAKFRFGGIKEIVGIEGIVAMKIEDISVDAICARFSDGIHDSATELSVFGVKAVGNRTKLFDRVQIRDQTGTKIASFTHVPAIHEEGVGGFALAVHREVSGRSDVAGNGAVLLHGT